MLALLLYLADSVVAATAAVAAVAAVLGDSDVAADDDSPCFFPLLCSASISLSENGGQAGSTGGGMAF